VRRDYRALAILAAAGAAFSAAACSGSSASPGNCVASVQSPLGVTVCPDAGVVQGVDVSVYQGHVDWAQVRDAGIEFAFARVSDGTGYPDTEFASNWPSMKAAGVARGAYQFFRPEEDPTAQANLFGSMLAAAGGVVPGDLPPVLDLETTDNTTDAMIQARMQTWFAAMQSATGMKPILYLSPSFAAHAGSGFTGHGLWVADWGVPCPWVPAGWSTWAFWQKSDKGSIPGIPSAVDLDEFDGPPAELPVLGTTLGADGGADGAPYDAGVAEPDGSDAAVLPSADGAPPSPHDAGAAAPDGSEQGSSMGGGPGSCR
jgi:lysozyme